MAKRLLTVIRQTIRQILIDEFASGTDLEWDDDELDIHIGECLMEISERYPYKVREVLTTIANSKVLDISDIADLIRIDRLEYKIGYTPRYYRNFNYLDDETIEIDTTITPSAGGSGTLTGTVTFDNGTAAITGSGTLFTTELSTTGAYHIKKSTGTRWYPIYSITSATALVLAEPCLEDDGADTINVTEYCYQPVYLHCEKVHTLTKDTSTLRPQYERMLVLGVCAKAAISKSQDQINAVNVGGTRTAADMQNWGLGQLGLYRAELAKARPRTSKVYPK